MRVPLLFPSAIVVSRLDIAATTAVDPDDAGPIAGGYDDDLREPYAYTDTDDRRVTTVRYMSPIRIPCQVEVKDFEEIRQVFSGDAPVTDMTFVLHNKDLVRMGLLGTDPSCVRSGGLLLKTNDRIDAVERNGKPGVISVALKELLYIYEIKPGSWGMGPSGQDLQIVFTSTRPAIPRG